MTTANRAQTTEIGSLPHHNVDAALAYCFKLGIPFLPQIPIRNPWENMVAQALEGIPGLQVEKDGSVLVNIDIWNSRAASLNAKLQRAFAELPSVLDAFESFEPSPMASSCWQPWIWELQERKIKQAKVQICGPMTAQWALRLNDGTPIDAHLDLTNQVFKLILARSLAMTRKLRSMGVQPILFLDEPGLYGLGDNPKHVLGMQELRNIVQTLQKEKVLVGIHCCSNTDWNQVLNLEPTYLSIDTELSLENLLSKSYEKPVDVFFKKGGRLALGIIPSTHSAVLHSLNQKELYSHIETLLKNRWPNDVSLVSQLLESALFTPACGLALHSVDDAETILSSLTTQT